MRKISLILAMLLSLYISCGLATQSPAPDNSNLQNELQRLQQALAQQKAKTATSAAATNQQPPATAAVTTTNPPVTATNPPAVNAAATNADNAQNAAATSVSLDSGGNLSDEAFGRMTTSTLPLTPAQIQMLRSLYDATQRAAALYPGVPPKPTSSSIAVDLSPGATPPIVRLGSGFVTSLVFVDSTGAPWPIQSYSIGNPTGYNVQWDGKSNILLIQAITSYRAGNLAVILKGLNTPVMIELKPGQAAMDVRADLRVPGLGPEGIPAVGNLPGTESPVLLALLDGIPPTGSKALQASACDNCAWLFNNKLYLRTQFNLISPAWISTLSSADGTHVYEMQPTPVILASYNGKTIKMIIQGF